MRLRLFVFALLGAASFSAAAGSVDVNLSNDTIEGKFYGNAGAADWTVGALYNRDTRDRALNVGLLATGDSAFTNSRVEGGLGGKIYSVTDAFYAPHVVTLRDGQRFFDVGVRAEVEVIRNSFVYIGYRQVQAELDNDVKQNVDKGGFIGLQVKF